MALDGYEGNLALTAADNELLKSLKRPLNFFDYSGKSCGLQGLLSTVADR